MTACLHHRDLCDAHQQTGHNQHRCFLDPGHDGAHRCVCFFTWQEAK